MIRNQPGMKYQGKTASGTTIYADRSGKRKRKRIRECDPSKADTKENIENKENKEVKKKTTVRECRRSKVKENDEKDASDNEEVVDETNAEDKNEEPDEEDEENDIDDDNDSARDEVNNDIQSPKVRDSVKENGNTLSHTSVIASLSTVGLICANIAIAEYITC